MRGGREHAWKRAALLLAAGAAAAGGCAWAVQGKLTTAWYEVPLPAGLEGLDGVKIAQISDVHSADLERPLGAALAAAAPDLIVMTGDLVNREDRAVLWSLRGEGVNLMGLWDVTHDPLGWAHAQAALPERVRALRREGALNVLLSHRPSLLEEYGAGGADVVFCGHAHGGQVRLPLAGPVFAPDEGLFPKHTAGVYQAGETRMVVSRGLGNGTPYPRLWNGPELVVVTMKRAGT